MTNASSIIIRQLGLQDYTKIFTLMKAFTDQRGISTRDEIWYVQHNPVFTQGQAGKDEYILIAGDIPIVKSDRGGHVTYHGPGQITAYLLIDLKRLNIGVRGLVSLIEKALVDTLFDWNIEAATHRAAPGVYVSNGKKIASLGLRIRKGCSYHGLNFNVDMDMSPWQRINPCGLDVEMTQLADLVDNIPILEEVIDKLTDHLLVGLGYNEYQKRADQPTLNNGF